MKESMLGFGRSKSIRHAEKNDESDTERRGSVEMKRRTNLTEEVVRNLDAWQSFLPFAAITRTPF